MKRRNPNRREGLHPLIAAGIHRAEKARKADVIARPMRELFALLMSGEVMEIDGRAVMRMPEIDTTITEQAQWCEIAPAIRGWIDCWGHLAAEIRLYHMGVLADRLERDQEITPRLVEQARDEFERTIKRLPSLPDGAILSAIRTTEIGWEFEKLEQQA
ncbi:hypothetical protein [Aromatoleum toluclasticum]|uniref:hypothetical protein n=1 Tax=Aromatoleum toluclasticum TaxID=92003 RepID=UPI00037758D0|nr:hypothetical protein [Aromatoleum toluclasticum]